MLMLLLACDPFGPITVSDTPVQDLPEPGQIQAELQRVDFGERSVLRDGPDQRTVTLTNVGEQTRAAPMLWLIEDPAFWLDAPPLIELAPGEQQDIVLHFDPLTEAHSSAALAWPDGTLSLLGSGAAPVARLLTESEHLGAVPVGCAVTSSVVLLNDGSETLEISALSVGTGAGFTLLTSPPPTLPAGQQITLQLEFAPLDGGERGTTVLVDSNDPLNPSSGVTLRALGVDGAQIEEFHDYLPGAAVDLLFVVDSGAATAADLVAAQSWTTTLFERFEQGRVDWQVSVANAQGTCHSTYDPYLQASAYTPSTAGPALAYGLNPQGAGTTELLALAQATLERSDSGECMAGFLRPQAHLHVVVISDRVESSAKEAEEWVATLQALTPSAQVMISAVAGTGAACPASAVLLDAVNATGGLYLDICSGDWDNHFNQLAQLSVQRSSSELTLHLEQLPVPQTIEVYAGARRIEAWSWDAEQELLKVDGELGELEVGEELRVRYVGAQECG